MELLNGGMDYGDLSCEEYWAGVSIAFGGSSFYVTALFEPFGVIGSFLAGSVATIADLNCD